MPEPQIKREYSKDVQEITDYHALIEVIPLGSNLRMERYMSPVGIWGAVIYSDSPNYETVLAFQLFAYMPKGNEKYVTKSLFLNAARSMHNIFSLCRQTRTVYCITASNAEDGEVFMIIAATSRQEALCYAAAEMGENSIDWITTPTIVNGMKSGVQIKHRVWG